MSDFVDDKYNRAAKRFVKTFVTFQHASFQPFHLDRIEKFEEYNPNAIGEGDLILFKMVIRLSTYPFNITFSYATENLRDEAELELMDKLRDCKTNIV